MKPNATALTVAIPGTCGELVQGWLAGWDEPVLVSCPIKLYSQVTVELFPGADILILDHANDYSKLQRAARLALNSLGRPELGALIRPQSQLERGRGLASSTADIVGAMVGVALALGYTIPPAELARLACQIEPSDSTMFAGLTMLAYRGSARHRELGPVPALPLLMLDAGPAIDTVRYNARLDLAAVRRLAPTTQAALALLEEGLSNQEAEAIGAAATLSALSYQVINPNPLIEPAARWAAETGAVGLVRAHSGSVIGLLYPAHTELSDCARWLSHRFTGCLWPTQLTEGSYLLVDHHPCPQALEVSSVL